MSTKSWFLALLITLLAPAVASADGLPVPVDDAGPSGILANDDSGRYVTVPAGKGTVVEQVDARDGRVLNSRFLPGHFTVPVVALSGASAGLSYNGHKLVLIRPRASFPRARTTLAVLDTRGLRVRRIITLKGDFSFDALSRDGSTVFLVNYIDPRDATRYRVRTLDPATGRLAPHPVVDPAERPDAMRGLPLDRVSSPDGHWQYTLYDGAGSHPFVHALDTEERRAKCIDLPAFPGTVDPYNLRLEMLDGGAMLKVGSLATVDTRTFKVTPASSRARPAPRKAGAGDDSSATPWIAGFGILLVAAGLALSLRSRRRARTHTATPA
jgi:hypothetical protein